MSINSNTRTIKSRQLYNENSSLKIPENGGITVENQLINQSLRVDFYNTLQRVWNAMTSLRGQVLRDVQIQVTLIKKAIGQKLP